MMVDGDENNSLYKERLSVSYNNESVIVEQEKKFIIRLTSPSLNEYELKGTGLPLNVNINNSFEGDTSTTNSSEDEDTEESS